MPGRQWIGRRLRRREERVERPVFGDEDRVAGKHAVELSGRIGGVEIDGDGVGGVGGDVVPAAVTGAAVELEVMLGKAGQGVVGESERGKVAVDDWCGAQFGGDAALDAERDADDRVGVCEAGDLVEADGFSGHALRPERTGEQEQQRQGFCHLHRQ